MQYVVLPEVEQEWLCPLVLVTYAWVRPVCEVMPWGDVMPCVEVIPWAEVMSWEPVTPRADEPEPALAAPAKLERVLPLGPSVWPLKFEYVPLCV